MCMKKIKKYLMLTLLFIIFLINTTSVLATSFNGSAGTAYEGGTSPISCTNKRNCYNHNNTYFIMQARLYYINNGSFEPIGNTIYLVNGSAKSYLKKYDLKLIEVGEFNRVNITYEDAANYLRTYYQDESRAKKILSEITGKKDYSEILSEESFPMGGKKGYRLIVEPAYIYVNPTFGNGTTHTYALMTPKGLAGEIVLSGAGMLLPLNKSLLGDDSQAQSLFNDINDVGIERTNKSYCSSINYNQLSDMTISCGYRMIDMHKYATPKKCYLRRITPEKNSDLKCTKTDENNVEYFKEYYDEKKCNEVPEDQKTNNMSGKRIHMSGTCKIYCTETAQISLPGNVSRPIQRGSYFAWPTRPDDTKGLYSMSIKSTMNCMIKDMGASSGSVGSVITMGCADGYTPISKDTCRSHTETTQKICPSGTEERNGQCYYLSDPIGNTAALTIKQVSKVCPDNTEIKSNKCYNIKKPTSVTNQTTAKKCPSGYSSTGKSGDEACSKTTTWYECPQYYSENPDGTGDYACRYRKYKYWGGEYGSVDGGKSSICESEYGGWFVNASYCNPYADPCCKIPDGYWYKPKVEKKKTTYKAKECPNGTNKDGSCKAYCSSGVVVTIDGKKKCVVCPANYKPSTINVGKCVAINDVPKICPSGSSWNATNKKCEQIVPPYCIVGVLTAVNGQNRCLTCSYGYVTSSLNPGKCVSTTAVAKICPTGYVDVGGTCYKTRKKDKAKVSCPEGYTMVGNKTCNKICNKNSLIDTVKTNITSEQTNQISAKLTTSGVYKIDKILSKTDTTTVTKNGDNIIFNRVVNFKIPENINRYYNRLTKEVMSQGQASEIIFDRGEGVVSVSDKDEVYNNNGLIGHNLTISDIKLGSGNQFGQKISTYKCTYTIAEDDDVCVCPSGTKNAGMSLNELAAKYCSGVNKTCSEWQYLLCDAPYSKILEIEGCTNKLYCNNTETNEKINITDCVKTKSIDENKNLDKAIDECTTKEKVCTNTWCFNKKNNSKVDISACLSEGNSRESCYKKMGCITDICENGKCCTGKCGWTYVKINNSNEANSVTYGYQICNNSRYCGFVAYCTNNSKKTSIHTNQCIKSKLNATSITGYLNNTQNLEKLKEAVKVCQKTICASSEKIIYRVVDLTNPFPGKDGIKNAVTLVNTNRTPGYNWNSETAINEQILNGRGASGYELYNKKPLITIKLTPKDIKAIKKYNESTPYNNFNMKCIKDQTSGCISYFLHENELNLDIDGVNNCTTLNASSSIEQFNNCYNKKN